MLPELLGSHTWALVSWGLSLGPVLLCAAPRAGSVLHELQSSPCNLREGLETSDLHMDLVLSATHSFETDTNVATVPLLAQHASLRGHVLASAWVGK